MAVRYQGHLKKWNAERGFGFIVADDGGAEIFVHITAFARDGRQPAVGEALSFDVEPDRNGKRSAVRVRRPGDTVPQAVPHRSAPHRASVHSNPPSLFSKLLGGLVVCVLAWWGYSHYAQRAASFDSVLPAPPVVLSPAKLPVPPDFKCDGRNMCSQMTSCKEATLFQQNCPGMKMDGNGDGVPCEQQWCNK